MSLYFRFFVLMLKRWFAYKKIGLFDECRTSFWVNPLDLDINLHMNNGRYLSIMDLGRMDLMIKSKTFWPLFKSGYYPVVVSESIRFKRSLEPFQFFRLSTQVESYNDKDFYMIQKFYRGKSIVAIGYIKGRFKKRDRKGSVTTKEIFQFVGAEYYEDKVSLIAGCQDEIESQLQ